VTAAPSPGPTVLDALSLLSEVAEELVVRSARDTHLAVLDRVRTVTKQRGLTHRGIAGAVYGGIGLGFRAAAKGLDQVAATGVGPRLEDGPRGRFVSSAVNGLIGDKLLRERPHMAIPMAIRNRGHDIAVESDALAATYPEATGRLVLFLHGLCENESYFNRHRDRTGTTYMETLSGLGWTPVLLRVNTGVGLRENGAALTALGQRLVEAWPTEVSRIALVGHSLGGLVIRAAGAVATDVGEPCSDPWYDKVSDVITLGTPHLGAPIARGIGLGSRGLGLLPETAAFGRILDLRSRGVHDLVAGLAEDVPPLPHARYHLVAATLTTSSRHPVGDLVGDLLVRPRSAYGRDRSGRSLFPGADVLHVGNTDHFGLLNHPEVHRAMRDWLA
jgi:Putative serine esterase (DUF676)